mmetsp:Transcript_45659/g.84730  ORF Transcript_45659/g.84730 Transcript_45659/m.84730 type:complete len:218 (-) Transcript_45659:237-890(-)
MKSVKKSASIRCLAAAVAAVALLASTLANAQPKCFDVGVTAEGLGLTPDQLCEAFTACDVDIFIKGTACDVIRKIRNRGLLRSDAEEEGQRRLGQCEPNYCRHCGCCQCPGGCCKAKCCDCHPEHDPELCADSRRGLVGEDGVDELFEEDVMEPSRGRVLRDEMLNTCESSENDRSGEIDLRDHVKMGCVKAVAMKIMKTKYIKTRMTIKEEPHDHV